MDLVLARRKTRNPQKLKLNLPSEGRFKLELTPTGAQATNYENRAEEENHFKF